jgi:hypothetical protein
MNAPAGIPAETQRAKLGREANCVVYFAQNVANGNVKIGYTGDLPRRIAALSSGAGQPVELLRTVAGGRSVEAWLHRRFAPYRITGEWFSFHSDMLDIVPPDEVPAIPRIVVRRDVRLTLRERVRDARRLGDEVGLSAQQVLTIMVGQMTNDEAETTLHMIGGTE